MKHITFYLDFISPYAYLAFEQLPKALEGVSYSVRYRPVLFAGMLKHYGQLGPAEIAPKRDWTYRQVLWLAQTMGIDMAMPSAHPFNPLPLLRLAMACSPQTSPARFNGAPNRYVCETIFRHVWRASAVGNLPLDAADPDRFLALAQHLAPPFDAQSGAVKELLTQSTQQAIAEGVFGVPAFVVDDKLFWGLDSLPMLRAYLGGDAWFSGADWDAAARVGAGLRSQ